MKRAVLRAFFMLVITAFMLALATACNRGSNDGGPVAIVDGRYESPVTLTLGKVTGTTFLPGDSIGDNPLTRHIRDVLNIEIVIDWEVPDTEAYNTQLALRIAAGDIPDLITLGTDQFLTFIQLANNDMLADLRPGYDAHANDRIRDILDSYGGATLTPFERDGELLALAGGRFGWEHNKLWMRQDWLDDSGFAAPVTVEDIENILIHWRDNPPGPDYVGMMLNAGDISNPMSAMSASPIFHAFGAYPAHWITGPDGAITYGSTLPEMRYALEVLQRWFANGLIDQQFVIGDWGYQTALISSGQTGTYFAPWWFPYVHGDFPHMNPGGELMAFNAPVNAAGQFSTIFPGPIGDMVMIREGHPNPEALVKMINVIFDAWRGDDAVGYELLRETREAGVNWVELFPTGSFNLEVATVIRDGAIPVRDFVHHGIVPEDATVQWLETLEAIRDFYNTRVVDGPNWVEFTARYIGMSPDLMHAVQYQYPAFYFFTESQADFFGHLQLLENTTFIRIVIGELPIEAFDQFVLDWYAQGGQIWTDEVREIVGR